TQDMLGQKCPYTDATQITEKLKGLVLDDHHVRAYAGALLDARVAQVAKQASDAIFRRQAFTQSALAFSDAKQEAKNAMVQAVANGGWREKCKGRDLLKKYAGEHGLNYEHFRNSIIAKMKSPPPGLAKIMDQILGA